jgi:membrane protein implicated in regulation of membrane protease activity
MTAFWVWIVVAIAFAIAEMMTVAFFAVFITIGALAAAVVSLLGYNLLVQAIVLGVVGVLGIVGARPYLMQRLHVGRPALRSGADSMIGEHTVLVDPIMGPSQPGHVKIAGELWPAQTEDGSSLPATTPVTVTGLRSTILIVRPTSSPSVPAPTV